MMKLEAGQKFKITRYEGSTRREDKLITRIGIVIAINKSNIIVQFENFKESFNIADFQQYKIEIRVNKQWIRTKIKSFKGVK